MHPRSWNYLNNVHLQCGRGFDTAVINGKVEGIFTAIQLQ
jgi:hypothetical protein